MKNFPTKFTWPTKTYWNYLENLENLEWLKKRALRNSGVFHDIRASDNNDFKDFRTRLADLRIVLSDKDLHVLYVACEKEADFVVSSDGNVINKTLTMKETFGLVDQYTSCAHLR